MKLGEVSTGVGELENQLIPVVEPGEVAGHEAHTGDQESEQAPMAHTGRRERVIPLYKLALLITLQK
jgi:hypothetical protein